MKTFLRGLLYKHAGSVLEVAREVGCSTPNLWHWLRLLKIDKEPRIFRAMAKNRFRLTTNTA